MPISLVKENLVDNPSVVTVTGNLVVQTGEWLNLTALNLPITVTDVDGDPLLKYRFTDLSGDPNSIYFWLNGIVAQGGTFTVAASYLSEVWIHSAATAGPDSIQIEVFDGSQWSAPQDITVITDTAPVVSAATTSFGLNQTVAASSIFNVFDADGDAITQYRITDATVGGAHLTLNGVQQADNTPILVSAADLAQLQIVTASSNQAANSFIVEAFDGNSWSAPKTIKVDTVAPPPDVTVTGSLIVAPGGWLNLTALNLPIVVTDADGDPVIKYRFTDLSSAPNGDYLWFNHTLAQGDSVTFSASQLSTLWVHSAAASGADMLQVEVFDGYQWSAPQDISIITDAAPVVSAATTSFNINQTVAATSIFNISDAESDAITQYKLTDLTAGGAYLTLNGVQQADDTPMTVAAADIAELQIVTAPSDQLKNAFAVQVFDGFQWSTPVTINVASMAPPPVVNVTGEIDLSPGQWFDFTALNLPFSVTGADLDHVVKYRFTDVGTGANSAHLWFNGPVAQGGTVTTPAAYLSQVWIQGGPISSLDTLQVQIFDGFQWSAPQDISVVTFLHGAGQVAATIGFPSNGGVTENIGVDAYGNLNAVGSIGITDPNPGEAAFRTTVTGAAGNLGSLTIASNGSYTFTVANAAAKYLAANASTVDFFTVTSIDGTQKQITFSIHGANDDPIITSGLQSGSVSEGDDGSSMTATGQITYTDADTLDTHTLTISSGPSYGTASVDANGNWTYTAIDQGAVDALEQGDHLADSFTVQVKDDWGGIASQVVNIDIVGTNDAPAITPDLTSAAPIDYGLLPTGSSKLSGTIGFVDPDFSDTHTVTYTYVGPGTATVSMPYDSTGGYAGEISWSIAIDNASLMALSIPDVSVATTGTLSVEIHDPYGGVASKVVDHTETVVSGDSGDNTLIGTSGDDIFVGNGGSDVFVSNGGYDVMFGSETGAADLDYADMQGFANGVEVDLGVGNLISSGLIIILDDPALSSVFTIIDPGSIGTGICGVTLHGIAGVIGTDYNDTFDASDFTSTSTNHTAYDVVGGAPFNVFEGLGGNDTIYGNGNTLVTYMDEAAGVYISLYYGSTAKVDGDDNFHNVSSFQGSTLNDTYDARGFIGVNQYETMGGNDIVYGNGSTELSFAHASSSVYVDLGQDFPAVYNGNTFEPGVPGFAAGGYGPDATNTAEIHGGIQTLIGSSFDDTLIGWGGGQTLDGGSGNDTIEGHGAEMPLLLQIHLTESTAGNATVAAGINLGSLDFQLNDGTTIAEGGDFGNPSAGSSAVAYAFGSNYIGDLSLTPVSADEPTPVNIDTGLGVTVPVTAPTIYWQFVLPQDTLDQQLVNGPVDQVQTYAVYVQDAAANMLTGGAGNDTFVFNSAYAPNTDTITDFTSGQDVLQVAATGFVGSSGQPLLTANQDVTVINTDTANFASLHADVTGGAFVNVSDGTNSVLFWAQGSSQDVATESTPLVALNNVTTLHASDFHVV